MERPCTTPIMVRFWTVPIVGDYGPFNAWAEQARTDGLTELYVNPNGDYAAVIPGNSDLLNGLWELTTHWEDQD